MSDDQRSAGRGFPAPDNTLRAHGERLWQRLNVPPVRVALGALLSTVFVWLAVRDVPLSEVLTTLSSARGHFLVLALLPVLVSPIVRALRWRLLYHPHQDGLRLLNMAAILLVSQMLNIVLPVRGGEVARTALMARIADRGAALTLGTLVVEKWLDLVVLLVLVLLVPLYVTLPPWFEDSRTVLAVFAASFLIVALVLSFGREHVLRLAAALTGLVPDRWRPTISENLEKGLRSLDVLRIPWVGLRLQACSFLIIIMSILVNYFVLLALGIALPIAGALFLLAVLQIGVAVPSTPGKVGVFQYLCILALSVFDVDRTAALGFGILLYLVVFLPPMLLGGLSLWWMMLHPGWKRDLSKALRRHSSA